MTRQSQHHDGEPGRRGPGVATSLSQAMLLALTLAPLGGCGGPDPEGKFNEYASEAEQFDLPPVRMDIPPPPPSFDLTGKSLLAISTIVSKDLPLQFISTVTQRQENDGSIFIDIELQPLSLEIGKVLVPRMPVGEPLVFKDIPVIDGKYTVDAGETMVTGAANPITGSDITATLVLAAEVRDSDFVCGAVTGMVTSPLMTTVDGSTFAAVRLADESMLPDMVAVNCNKDTKTDK